MAISWSDEYATGVSAIDRQHQKLFGYVNQIETYIKNNVYEGKEIDDLLNFLTDYTLMHFSHEEFCMKEKKCPSAERNKKAHEDFIGFFTDFKKQYARTPSLMRKDLLVKLQRIAEDWLKSHICKIDLHLKNCENKI